MRLGFSGDVTGTRLLISETLSQLILVVSILRKKGQENPYKGLSDKVTHK